MAGSQALSAELLALFQTVRQQAQAYAEAFTRVEELLQELQQHRERFQRETEYLRDRGAALLEHLRQEFERITAPLLQRAAALYELSARLERLEAESARLRQLPEQFAGHVAESIVQMEQRVRTVEQKLALALRSLHEELRHWEQRVEAIRLLTQRDLGEVQQQLQKLHDALNLEQFRRQLIQTLEPRFQKLEAELTEIATALLQLTREEAPPQQSESPPEQHSSVIGEELPVLRHRIAMLERRIIALRVAFLLLTAGVLAALLFGLLHG